MVEVNPRGVVTGCGAVGGAAADLASALLGSDAGGACLPRVSSALSGTDGETASGCSRDTLSTRDSLAVGPRQGGGDSRSEEHTSELQSLTNIVCRLLL